MRFGGAAAGKPLSSHTDLSIYLEREDDEQTNAFLDALPFIPPNSNLDFYLRYNTYSFFQKGKGPDVEPLSFGIVWYW